MSDLDPRVRVIARVIWDAENGDGDYDRACRQIPGTMSMPSLALNITAGKCITALEATLSIDLTAIAEGRMLCVPVEPTNAMLTAGAWTMIGDLDIWEGERASGLAYRAMIAAKE